MKGAGQIKMPCNIRRGGIGYRVSGTRHQVSGLPRLRLGGLGHWLLVAGCWVLVAGCWLLGSGCRLLVAGYWLLVAGFWLLVAGCWLLVAGFWLLVAGYWVLVAGCWLQVTGLVGFLVRATCRGVIWLRYVLSPSRPAVLRRRRNGQEVHPCSNRTGIPLHTYRRRL